MSRPVYFPKYELFGNNPVEDQAGRCESTQWKCSISWKRLVGGTLNPTIGRGAKMFRVPFLKSLDCFDSWLWESNISTKQKEEEKKYKGPHGSQPLAAIWAGFGPFQAFRKHWSRVVKDTVRSFGEISRPSLRNTARGEVIQIYCDGRGRGSQQEIAYFSDWICSTFRLLINWFLILTIWICTDTGKIKSTLLVGNMPMDLL